MQQEASGDKKNLLLKLTQEWQDDTKIPHSESLKWRLTGIYITILL